MRATSCSIVEIKEGGRGRVEVRSIRFKTRTRDERGPGRREKIDGERRTFPNPPSFELSIQAVPAFSNASENSSFHLGQTLS